MVQETATIQSAQSGNIEAFNELVLQYQDRVYNTAYRIMGDPASADDITQDVFITAYRKLSQFKGGNFQAWITRIAVNTCYDELRRRKRRPAESLDGEEIDAESNPRLASKANSPEKEAQDAELRSAIEECFAALSDDFRIVVTMSDVEGYSYDEIAEAVNISLGTVKSRISRARARLRDCLRSMGELLPGTYRQ